MKKPFSLGELGIRFVEARKGVEEYVLNSNGMRIVLNHDDGVPVVDFMVLYRCGSRNEGAGTTGSAHFFEHLMFKGTRKFDPKEGNGAMELFGRVGAFINANTSNDRTRYFECIPSQYLPLAIEFEADRMRGLKNRKSDRDSEMTVVRNEFERGENSPSSVLWLSLMATAFREHPYHIPTIGYRTDVEGVSLKRMVEFYDQQYWPNNAVALVVGDFDREEALTLIAKHFGRIPASPQPIPQVYTVEPPQEGERRFEIRRAGGNAELLIGWHTPDARHPDIHALDVLSHVLGNGNQPASRLYKALVDKGLAASCYASNLTMRDPGLFMVNADLTPGTALADVEAAIYAELAKLAQEPATEEEISRVKDGNRKGTILNNDDLTARMGLLSNAEGMDTWRWSVDYDDKYDAVTPADVMRVASTYFAATNRTVGAYVPDESIVKPEAKPVETKPVRQRQNKQKRIEIEPPASRKPLAPSVTRLVLPNGLTIAVLPRPGRGAVAVSGSVFAGSAFASKSTQAQLTAQMLTSGSAHYSKEQLGAIIGRMGANFGFGSELYRSRFDTLIDASDLEQFVTLLADVIANPVFTDAELATAKRKLQAKFKAATNDTSARAYNAFVRAIYPAGHPHWQRTFDEALAALADMSVEDLRAFHSAHYNPKSTILTVVGDVDAEKAVELLSWHFGTWSGGDRAQVIVPQVPGTNAGLVTEILPGKANVDICIGRATEIAESASDFFAVTIANNALGRSTISDRLGKVIRVANGLTYGVNTRLGDTAFGAAPWYVGLSVNPANVDKALALVRQVVEQYRREGIGEYELADNITKLAGGFTVENRSSRMIAQALNRYEFLGLGVQAMDTYADKARATTKAEVDAAIAKYFDLDTAVTALAGTIKR
jgi:zinc protease